MYSNCFKVLAKEERLGTRGRQHCPWSEGLGLMGLLPPPTPNYPLSPPAFGGQGTVHSCCSFCSSQSRAAG